MLRRYSVVIYMLLCSLALVFVSELDLRIPEGEETSLLNFVLFYAFFVFLFWSLMRFARRFDGKNKRLKEWVVFGLETFVLYQVVWCLGYSVLTTIGIVSLLSFLRITWKYSTAIMGIFVFPIIAVCLTKSFAVKTFVLIAWIAVFYDAFAVWVSKHMVEMASFLMEVRHFHPFLLIRIPGNVIGAGDIIFALIFQCFALKYGIEYFVATLLVQTIVYAGMSFIVKKFKKPLPALVFIVPFSTLSIFSAVF